MTPCEYVVGIMALSIVGGMLLGNLIILRMLRRRGVI